MLAGERRNLCVVGDDDQALYRFRGATVENFVNFPERCKKYYKIEGIFFILTYHIVLMDDLIKIF